MSQTYITQQELIKKSPLITKAKLFEWRSMGMPFIQFKPKGKIYYIPSTIENWLNQNIPLSGEKWQLR